jgi:hypothetical protein
MDKANPWLIFAFIVVVFAAITAMDYYGAQKGRHHYSPPFDHATDPPAMSGD